MELLDKVWLAAVLDSETNITSWDPPPSMKRRRKVIQIANSSREFMERAREIIGYGNITWQDPRNPNWKRMYYLKITKRGVVNRVLEAVLPYLIAKRTVAQKVLMLP